MIPESGGCFYLTGASFKVVADRPPSLFYFIFTHKVKSSVMYCAARSNFGHGPGISLFTLFPQGWQVQSTLA